jgi:hypothetical protein
MATTQKLHSGREPSLRRIQAGNIKATGALVSISPTFNEQLLRQNPFARTITNPNCKHAKAAQKTFVRKSCS